LAAGATAPAQNVDALPPDAPQDGVIAYYPLDGDVSNAFQNAYHGYPAHTVFVNNTKPTVTRDGGNWSIDRFGRAGRCIFFNAVNEYAIIPDPPDDALDLPNVRSISVWFKAYRKRHQYLGALKGRNYCVLSKYVDDTPTEDGYRVMVWNLGDGTPELRAWVKDDSGGGGPGWSLYEGEDAVIEYTEWVHSCITYEPNPDGATATVRIYMDGVKLAETSDVKQSSGNGRYVILGAGTGANNKPWAWNKDSGNVTYGGIDDVLFYDRVLTDAEVEAIAASRIEWSQVHADLVGTVLDTNGDGVVSPSEMADVVTSFLDEEGITEMIGIILDADGNGEVRAEEICNLVTNLLSRSERQRLIPMIAGGGEGGGNGK